MSGPRDLQPGRLPGGSGRSSVSAAGGLLVAGLLAVLPLASPALAAAPAHARATTATAGATPTAATVEEPTDDPLDVSVDTVSPAVVPESGPVTITGSVTNNGIETWEDVKVYGLLSAEPMTTPEQLAEAAATPADAVVGERVTEPGSFPDIGDLAPGTTRSFAVRLPNAVLPDAGDGVYWLGLQALGANEDGRDDIADGRTRTFLPRVGETGGDSGYAAEVDTAFVVPVRQAVRRDAAGRVRNLDAWADGLAPGGRLDRLLDFGAEAETAGAGRLTWLLDPAVPDTVGELVVGNGGLDIGPTIEPGEDGGGQEPSPEPGDDTDDSDDTDASDGADQGSGGASPDQGPDLDPAAEAAQARIARAGTGWLEQLRSVLDSGSVLALPYGDLDVDTAVRSGTSFHERARDRSEAVTAAQGLEDARPVVAPPSGYVDPATLAALPDSETVLVSDRGVRADGLASAVRVDGRTLAVSSSAAATGGPGPDDPLDPVSVRQRLVSEAALRLIAPATDAGENSDPSLVVTMPDDWDPTPGTGFFSSLADVDWLNLTSLDDAMSGAGSGVEDDVDSVDPTAERGLTADAVVYPETERARELPDAAVASAEDLTDAAGTLQDVLPLNDSVAQQALDEALVGLSYANRSTPEVAVRSLATAQGRLRDMLGAIDIEAPTSLTLSSDDGDFSVQLSNDLPEPVVVRLRAVTDGPLEIRAPAQVEVPAGAGTTVRMPVSSTRVGVSNVDVELTDSRGNPLGASDSIPVRSVQIGDVIWWILGVGSALLLSAIVLRLVRRVVAARRAAAAR